MASMSRRDNIRGRPRDVKQRTIRRFAALDADIMSRYDEDEDEERLPIEQRSRHEIRGQTARRGRTTEVANRQTHMSGPGRRDVVYKVTVRNGGRGNVDNVLDALHEVVAGFLPFNAAEDFSHNVTFYVSTVEEADNLRAMSRRVYHQSAPSEKFTIYYGRITAAWDSLDQRIKQAIRDVVAVRYDTVTNVLDLSAFQYHQIFADRDLRNLCSLTRNAVMYETINAAADLHPNITGLSLKKNRLTQLDTVLPFTFACRNVTELDLSDNNLETAVELKKICRWNVEKIFLENNQLCAAFSNASDYTSAVHDHLPRVTFLDGSVVQSDPLKIKAEEDRRAGNPYPPPRAVFCPSAALMEGVQKILTEYFDIYDKMPAEKARQALFSAYDEEATFTHSIYTLPHITSKNTYRTVPRGDEDAYRNYIRSSHNLVCVEKWMNYREKIVYKGAMAIAVALSGLPATQHDRGSFQLEFVTMQPQLLICTLRGLVRDGNDHNKPDGAVKFFMRTFAIVPRDGGFVRLAKFSAISGALCRKMSIINDTLLLSPVGLEREERFRSHVKRSAEAPVAEPPSIAANMLALNGLSSISLPGPSGFQQELQRKQLEQQQQAAAIAQAPPPQIAAFTQAPPIQMAAAISQAPPPQAAAAATSLPYDRNDPNIQQAMIQAFSAQSGMKPDWSQRCLEELNWDFEAAGSAFNEQHARIPKEAFI